jgi:hypothetical protein
LLRIGLRDDLLAVDEIEKMHDLVVPVSSQALAF